MIRVAFRFGDKRLFSRLVCLFRGGDSAHCEAVQSFSSYSASICASASWVDGGVRYADIYLDPAKWRVYEIDLHAYKIEDWMSKHQGDRYDMLGLLGIFLPTIFPHSRKKWFCSEAVADMLGLEDPHLFDLRLLESYCARIGRRVD